MSKIEDRLRALFEAMFDHLTRLPEIRATTLEGVAQKLSVATASVLPDENVGAHALLQSTLDDLTSLLEARGSAGE